MPKEKLSCCRNMNLTLSKFLGQALTSRNTGVAAKVEYSCKSLK